ncbi:MAG TPA: Gfo/Idh/MocA family oxidoreductase [Patescibacteria group bacterium]|nr:Gfo/Idh/MocA family oxidoreductase [Patescibacteria group bacterium]
MRKNFRCGVVGCGSIARSSHLPILKRTEGVDVVAVCDQSASSAKLLAKAFKIPNIYEDFSSMLENEELDFVSICSPPHTHCEFTMLSTQKGLHVLLEKPMALDTSEADKMLLSVKENNVKLCVVHNFLYNPAVQKALSLVASGQIGRILYVDIKILEKPTGPLSNPDHYCHRMRGGRIGDLVEHPVYLIIKLLGKVGSVKAVAKKLSHFPWVERDEISVLLEAQKGIGSFHISCNADSFSHAMEIRGTRKSIFVNNFFMTMVSHAHAGSVRLRDFAVANVSLAAQLIGTSLVGTLRGKFGHRWYRDGHRRIIADFVRSIGNDTDPPGSAQDSRECLKVFEEAWSQV